MCIVGLGFEAFSCPDPLDYLNLQLPGHALVSCMLRGPQCPAGSGRAYGTGKTEHL